MDDWTSVLAALGVPALWVGPLILLIRAGWPEILHALRVWRVDRAAKRAAGLMHSLRVASGTAGAPLDMAGLNRLLDSGCGYMRQRLGGTLDALGIDAPGLRDLVQGEFGALLAGLSPPVVPQVAKGTAL